MAEVTVADFAKVLKVPVDRLIEQLDEAGIKVGGPNDVISEDASSAANAPEENTRRKDAATRHPPITLNRAQSELKLASNQGRAARATSRCARSALHQARRAREQARKQQE